VSRDEHIGNGAWFVPDTTLEVTSTIAVAGGEGFNDDCEKSYGSPFHTFPD